MQDSKNQEVLPSCTESPPIAPMRNTLASVVEALESLPAWAGVLAASELDQRVVFRRVRPTSGAHAGLVRSVARKWLVSCVARAMQPGCKVDTMLILEGRQGIGKSRALAALAGERFFSDAAIDFASKDACQTIQGVWIFELAELDALLRRGTSTVKAFVSRSIDRFRVPYGRVPEDVPRSVVFAGTVNHGSYLSDTTGNRRYWVVRCEGRLDVESRNARVTRRVSRLLARLGYERRRRNTVPRSDHYVRSDAPLSHCPTWRQLISPARPTARVGS